jgi:hypothetical protein
MNDPASDNCMGSSLGAMPRALDGHGDVVPSTKNRRGGVGSSSIYPSRPSDRTRWIMDRRGPKNLLDPAHAYASLWEEEVDASGHLIPTATLFLTNRECPYRCLMCDLWRNTLDESVPADAIPAQIVDALSTLPPARQVKLYNAGSFFDPRAIPVDDYPSIAELMAPYDRVIVECHPKLIGKRVLDFKRLLETEKGSVTGVDEGRLCALQAVTSVAGARENHPRLEVAIGLETVHEAVLEKLNKRFTLDDFHHAAAFLKDHDIDLRVFLLVRPPFMTEEEGVEWAKRSLDFAFDCGASVVCVIPTRAGNGAMEALRDVGEWSPPSIRSLEEVHEYGVGLGRGRVFADLWDIERFYVDEKDTERHRRMEQMNRTQTVKAKIPCAKCGSQSTIPIVGRASLPVS